ncbi:aryl-sulfate sulfotransferase [Halobacillus amylolyticus]|uniref:Aryl-sulfate sulfotransferase n=1 Tax=Halobacillus amylolyticus TaxID=2932259 RepID=A0ABY4HA80_9BACI|nr:aryl-sulfate sulfotransferase [Halobacillus amylolyticus]UOR11461.1 aryl-sulfate sulfotransferase [Halobacillus amylolyticus]
MKKIGITIFGLAMIVRAILIFLEMNEDQRVGGGTRTVSADTELINEQDSIENVINTTYSQRNYNFNDPLVIPDPYGIAPLTALVKFETEEPLEITVTVNGKEDAADISETFSGYEKSHEIPVLGLYPDYENTVMIEGKREDGTVITKGLTINTDPLPEDFLTTELIEADREKMENGLTFIIPSSMYAYAVDSNADVRWYSTLPNSHVFKRMENSNLIFLTEKTDKYNQLVEMNMLGQVSNAYVVEHSNYEGWGVIHHDVIELPGGNLLATTHDTSQYIEDEMIEIDRQSGDLVDQLNMRNILPEDFYQEYDGPSEEDGDWFHQNAIWYDELEGDILVSSRHQSTVLEMSYPEGEIDWILAAHEGWPEDYQQYLLEPVGQNFKFPGGPHAVMTLPDQDNNEATKDILLFDNNIAITRGDESVSEEYSRGVQYRINTQEMTVKEIWAYGEQRGKSFYSSIVSDANFLSETGNRLITSGYTNGKDGNMRSIIVEVTDEKPAQVVYELKVTGFEKGSHRQIYRSERMPLYPEGWNFRLGQKD